MLNIIKPNVFSTVQVFVGGCWNGIPIGRSFHRCFYCIMLCGGSIYSALCSSLAYFNCLSYDISLHEKNKQLELEFGLQCHCARYNTLGALYVHTGDEIISESKLKRCGGCLVVSILATSWLNLLISPTVSLQLSPLYCFMLDGVLLPCTKSQNLIRIIMSGSLSTLPQLYFFSYMILWFIICT